MAPKESAARVLDLGVGSGAILLALLAERSRASGVGVDASEAALAVAQANAQRLGVVKRVDLRRGHWGEGVREQFDLVVSNPPYIPSAEIAGLQPEVARYEPRLALDGGPDGLAAHRAIVADLPRLLAPGGGFALEVGKGQAEAVAALAQAQGLVTAMPRMDLQGVPRVVSGRRAA
jgi:release factor glutamine methyltransferase